jgi:curved DNA-binding protein CbpA
MKESLYEVLGVDVDADAKAIRAAYLKKAKEHHPDKAGGDTEAFQAVNHANEVLSDPERRKRYDETGDDSDQQDLIEKKAFTWLSQAFDKAISSGRGTIDVSALRYLNVPGEMRKHLTEVKASVQGHIDSGVQLRDALRDMYVRVEMRPDRDAFGEVVVGKIRQIESEMKNLEQSMAVVTRALALLDGYSYRSDDWPKGSYAASGFTVTSPITVEMLKAMFIHEEDEDREEEDGDG